MARVLVTRRLPGGAVDRLAAVHEVDVLAEGEPAPAELVRERAAEADGMLVLLTDRVDAELIAAAPRLRVISNFAVGSDNIDLAAAAAAGVAVGVTPDVLTDATAELTIALLLACARRLPEATADVRAGRWRTWEPEGWLGLQLRGSRIAIVGPGRIGRRVAELCAGLGMEVSLVGRDDDLLDAVAGVDAVSLHLPLTPATSHLVDADFLRAMSESAVLVNTGRGGLVDQAALEVALRERWIAGAGLDVTDPEPLPPAHPLLAAPNLLVLPHIGSATVTARTQMAERAVDNLLAGLAGDPLPFPAVISPAPLRRPGGRYPS
jgi:glyoxylate reductase